MAGLQFPESVDEMVPATSIWKKCPFGTVNSSNDATPPNAVGPLLPGIPMVVPPSNPLNSGRRSMIGILERSPGPVISSGLHAATAAAKEIQLAARGTAPRRDPRSRILSPDAAVDRALHPAKGEGCRAAMHSQVGTLARSLHRVAFARQTSGGCKAAAQRSIGDQPRAPGMLYATGGRSRSAVTIRGIADYSGFRRSRVTGHGMIYARVTLRWHTKLLSRMLSRTDVVARQGDSGAYR
jgi:hypothetical protein